MNKEIIFDSKERKKYLKEFNAKYPEHQSGIIGRSILGKDIDYYKIGEGKKNIVVVGAHHGMEYLTASALYDFVDFLCENAARDRVWNGINLAFLVRRFAFWIIPCINPDGVELNVNGLEKSPLRDRQIKMNGGSLDFGEWQANARGVDLNHNYNFGFAEYKKIERELSVFAGKTRYAGEYPESEPETKALCNLIRTLLPTAVVSLHSQGREIYFKPETDRHRRIAEGLAKSVGYKLSVPEGCAAYGGLSDYTGGVLGIPSFTVEVGKGKNPLPLSELRGICDAVRKLLVFLPTRL